MSQLPKGWKEVQIKDITQVIGGGTPSTSKKEYFDGDIPWVTPADLSGYKNTYISRGRRNLTKEGLEASSARLLPKDAVLYSTRAPIGYVAISKNPLATNQGFKSILPSETVDSKYTYYYLKSIKAYAESEASGTTFKELSGKKFGELKFPLAPLPEQKLIVAKLDILFAHLDQLRARLDKIPVLLKQFRQAVLTQAVTGKLTEEWRKGQDLQPVIYALKRIADRRKALTGRKKGKLTVELRKDLDLYNIPDTWQWSDLEFLFDESDSFCYGVVQPGNKVDGEQKLIRVQDLENGRILTNALRGVSWKIDSGYQRSKVKSGDLLITVVGTIGRTAIVQETEGGFNIARAVAKIPIRDFNARYVKIFLDSTFGQTWLNDDAREVARKTLNLDQLKTLPIPVPPIEEQEQLVRKVESLYGLADKVEGYHRSLMSKVDQLPQVLLSRTFSGKLVDVNAIKKKEIHSSDPSDQLTPDGPKVEYR